MTRKQEFEKLVKGERMQKTLFSPILMHFAARHIGKTYGAFASDHNVLVEANCKVLEDFDMDMVSLISDPYREASAFGAEIRFMDEEVPRCLTQVIQDDEDIEKLEIPDVYAHERTRDRILGAEAYTSILKGKVPVIGWIEGPLAEACNLMGITEMLMHLMMNEDASEQLLDKCLAMGKSFAKAQIEAGCHIIGMGDAVCSQIDADTYNRFVKDRHAEIIRYIHNLGARVKLHICGNITHLLPSLKDIHADIVDLDWQVDMAAAREVLGAQTILCGNINPVVIQDRSPDEVFVLTKKLVEQQKGQRFILSGGCEITVNTPPANLLAMRKASL